MFVPLSSGEESYLRQEDAQRRRKLRLKQVREEEKRIAHERTQWYKQRTLELQTAKRRAKELELDKEKEMVLSDLHEKYRAALDAIGEAHRQAHDYNENLQARARRQLSLLASNDVVVDQRFANAITSQEEMNLVREAKIRVIQENMRKVQEIAERQRKHAEKVARIKLERDISERKQKEIMTQRVEENAEHIKVLADMSTSRLHASAPARIVHRHNVRHSKAINAWREGDKKRLMEDVRHHNEIKQRQTRVDKARKRGHTADDVEASHREASATLQWLYSLDKQTKQGNDRKDILYSMADKEKVDAITERAREVAFEQLFDEESEEVEKPIEPLDEEKPRAPSRNILKPTPPPRRPPVIPSDTYFPRFDEPQQEFIHHKGPESNQKLPSVKKQIETKKVPPAPSPPRRRPISTSPIAPPSPVPSGNQVDISRKHQDVEKAPAFKSPASPKPELQIPGNLSKAKSKAESNKDIPELKSKTQIPQSPVKKEELISPPKIDESNASDTPELLQQSLNPSVGGTGLKNISPKMSSNSNEFDIASDAFIPQQSVSTPEVSNSNARSSQNFSSIATPSASIATPVALESQSTSNEQLGSSPILPRPARRMDQTSTDNLEPSTPTASSIQRVNKTDSTLHTLNKETSSGNNAFDDESKSDSLLLLSDPSRDANAMETTPEEDSSFLGNFSFDSSDEGWSTLDELARRYQVPSSDDSPSKESKVQLDDDFKPLPQHLLSSNLNSSNDDTSENLLEMDLSKDLSSDSSVSSSSKQLDKHDSSQEKLLEPKQDIFDNLIQASEEALRINLSSSSSNSVSSEPSPVIKLDEEEQKSNSDASSSKKVTGQSNVMEDKSLPCFDLSSSFASSDEEMTHESLMLQSLRMHSRRLLDSSSSSSSAEQSMDQSVARERILELLNSSSSSSSSTSSIGFTTKDLDAEINSTLERMQRILDKGARNEILPQHNLSSLSDSTRQVDSHVSGTLEEQILDDLIEGDLSASNALGESKDEPISQWFVALPRDENALKEFYMSSSSSSFSSTSTQENPQAFHASPASTRAPSTSNEPQNTKKQLQKQFWSSGSSSSSNENDKVILPSGISRTSSKSSHSSSAIVQRSNGSIKSEREASSKSHSSLNSPLRSLSSSSSSSSKASSLAKMSNELPVVNASLNTSSDDTPPPLEAIPDDVIILNVTSGDVIDVEDSSKSFSASLVNDQTPVQHGEWINSSSSMSLLNDRTSVQLASLTREGLPQADLSQETSNIEHFQSELDIQSLPADTSLHSALESSTEQDIEEKPSPKPQMEQDQLHEYEYQAFEGVNVVHAGFSQRYIDLSSEEDEKPKSLWISAQAAPIPAEPAVLPTWPTTEEYAAQSFEDIRNHSFSEDSESSFVSSEASSLQNQLLPPMPYPAMPMNVPPPPMSAGLKVFLDSSSSSFSSSIPSENEENLSIADQLRLRNPQLYERMQRRREEVKLDPPASTRSSKAERRLKAEQDRLAQSQSLPSNPTLARLNQGERVRVSSQEMKQRSRRMYEQLPEVIERKKQQELLSKRLERLQKLRQDEKIRRKAKQS
ncbi:hypothetical protein THRCLA_05503 [Thraustotheca clavata]|uniref:ALMS motif domain-containing protein n=1 Tax=Thraustotheca clavata TaxID=74557 RepID=A0A1V9ZVP1_9STRA|nr:hypothetical protein THRCLA_05503 [Thraustotheca clavata]